MDLIPLRERFDALAGTSYGVAGLSGILSSLRPTDDRQKEALLYWLLVAEALARSDEPEGTWTWLVDQLAFPGVGERQVAMALRLRVQNHWTDCLPVLVFSSPRSLETNWITFCRHFPVADLENRAIRNLQHHLIRVYGRQLFRPGDWKANVPDEQRYDTPDRCSIVKLRISLKTLAGQGESDEQKLMETWRARLREAQVLESLPTKLSRGFASEWPVFEDLVLALLQAAEWLPLANYERIYGSLRDMDRRPQEAFTPDQAIFAGALLGWIHGYRKAGGWVQDPHQRRALSAQALALTIADIGFGNLSYPGIDPSVFYLTPSGTRSEFIMRYLRPNEWRREERHMFGREALADEVVCDDAVVCDVAGGAFHFSLKSMDPSAVKIQVDSVQDYH